MITNSQILGITNAKFARVVTQNVHHVIKYGRVSHQDDKEKQKNCHDNSGFVHDENYKQTN